MSISNVPLSSMRVMTPEIDLFNADCLEIMENVIPDNSIDLTVTSPPYDNLREYNGMKPFTFEVFKPIADALFKITKPGGVVVWNVNDATIDGSETGTSFRQALYFKEIGFNLYDTMIYKKDGIAFPDVNRYQQCFEYMFVFSKGKPSIKNIIRDHKNISFGRQTGQFSKRQKDGTTLTKASITIAEYGFRWNIWEINAEKANKTGHPAVFPITIPMDHIRTWTTEGMTVFDPFLGSGTTGLAAKQLNRNFIGTERDSEYFKIAENRINAA